MRSKISFFSTAVLRRNLARFWPLWGSYLAIWLVVLPCYMAVRMSSGVGGEQLLRLTERHVLECALNGGMVIIGLFSVLAAMAVWSCLYSNRSVGMFASLPISRSGLFVTNTVTILLVFFVCHLVVFLAALGVEALFGVLNILPLLQWLAVTAMLTVLFVGVTTLCAMLTGHLAVLPVLAVVLSFTAVVVELLVRYILGEFVFGLYASDYSPFCWLSPVAGLMMLCGVGNYYEGELYTYAGSEFHGWLALGIYAAAGLLLLMLALALYRRRRMESAGDVVAVAPLKPVFRYCFSLGCALVLGSLLYILLFSGWSDGRSGWSEVIKIALLMMIGAFVGFFAAQMLIKKTFRVLRQGWPGLLIIWAVILVGLGVCEADLLGYERRIPDAEDVEYVYIDWSWDGIAVGDREIIEQVLAVHEAIVADKAKNEALRQDYDYVERQVTIRYQLKGDSTISLSRRYSLPCLAEDADTDKTEISSVQMLLATVNSKPFIDQLLSVYLEGDPANLIGSTVRCWNSETESYDMLALSPQEAEELFFDCIYPDLLDGSMKLFYGRKHYGPDEEVYACPIELRCMERLPDGDWEASQEFRPTVQAMRTSAWLRERGLELKTFAQVNAELEPKDEAAAAPIEAYVN